MLDPCCDFQCPPHPWPWPSIFKVKFWKCSISGIGGPVDMERKGCESIGYYTHFVTSNFDLTHDLDLEFSRSNFEKVISQEWDGRLTWNERDVQSVARVYTQDALLRRLELLKQTLPHSLQRTLEWKWIHAVFRPSLIFVVPATLQRSHLLKLAWKNRGHQTNKRKWSSRWSSPTSEAVMNPRLWLTSTLMLPLTHHPVPVESKPSVTHMMLTVRQTRKKLPLLALGAAVNHPWDLLAPEMTKTKYPMTEKGLTEARWSPFVHSTAKDNVAMGYQAKDVQEPIPLSAVNWWIMGTKVPGDVQRVRIAIVFILKCAPHPSTMLNTSMTHAACIMWKALADWTHAHTLRSRAVGTNRMLRIKGMTEIYQPSPHLTLRTLF